MVEIFELNTTCGIEYHLVAAKNGKLLRISKGWKTRNGAIRAARKHGFEVAEQPA